MTKDGQWDKLSAEISDDVLRLFAAIGRHDEIVTRIEQRFGGLSDTVYASTSSQVRSTLPPDLIADVQRIPAAFAGFDTASRAPAAG
jgi:hypothetical protein